MTRLRSIFWTVALAGLVLALPVARHRWSRPAAAQDAPASLVADRVRYDGGTGLLTAEGDVEVFYEERVLRAARIVYDEAAGEIRATGPIVLTDAAGQVVLADSAALSPDLADGLIRGARVLIAGKLQLAATEVRRTGGRFTSLYRTVASSCEICAANPTPTWAIRAARVTEDRATRQIYFEGATLEIFGLPVAYLPYLRIPDPSLARASGFLVPELRNSDIYGFGLRVPYYQVLGPASDATIIPFLTTGGASIFEAEYRRRFRAGGFDVAGVFALDDGLGSDSGRGFLTAQGAFALGRGFDADFDLNLTSDDSFLRQFDYSDADRLTSTARIFRTRLEDHAELGTVGFQSLRPEEETGQVPFVLPELTYRRLFSEPATGGMIAAEIRALGLLRDLGRDVVRGGFGLDWRSDTTLPRGVLAAAFASADADIYHVRDDTAFGDTAEINVTQTLGAEVRWPLARAEARAVHVLEPIVQVLHTGNRGQESVPNEDSQLPEFDETNLFALNRLPGVDRVETGLRANVGVSYFRRDAQGWTLGATVGRVFRAEARDDFFLGSGLSGRSSDWVTALAFELRDSVAIVNRTLFDRDLDFRRNELELTVAGRSGALSASYIFLAGDDGNPLLGPVPQTREVSLDGRYRFAPNWQIRGGWRYDLANDSSIRADAGLTYGNECAELDLSVSRRFTSSDNVPPATSVGLSLRLNGLGTDGAVDWPTRGCRG